MKKVLYIFLAVFTAGSGFAQNEQPGTFSYGLKDLVKEVKEYGYSVNQKQKVLTDSGVYQFDNEGHLKKLETWLLKEKLQTIVTIVHDNRGLMLAKNTREIRPGKKTKDIRETEYRYAYDQKTRMEQILEFDPKTMNLSPYCSFYYDVSPDLNWKQGEFPPKSEGPSPLNYVSGADGVIVGASHKSAAPGAPEYYDMYTYNEKRELLHAASHYLIDSAAYSGLAGEQLIMRIKEDSLRKIAGNSNIYFTRDTWGNELTQTLVNGDSSLMYIITYSYTFDKNNNWIARTAVHEQKARKGKNYISTKKFQTFCRRKIVYY